MKHFSTPRLGARAAACLLWLCFSPSFAQMVKEDRNNYPQPQKIKKVELLVPKAPFVFSPHLSYKEQKQIQMAKNKVGGITFIVKSSRKSQITKNASANYKQPNLFRKPKQFTPAEKSIADTTAPYVRYELSDTTNQNL
jgi:hypothetical protein